MSWASQCLVVVGTHRSGTSTVAGICVRQGWSAGDSPLPIDEHNPRGYYEHADVMDFHDRVFAEVGTNWRESTDPLALASSEQRAAWVAEATYLYCRLSVGRTRFCLKDPRIARLLPVWADAFATLDVQASYLVVVRDPRAVAVSLGERDELSVDECQRLWMHDMKTIAREVASTRHAVVHYERVVRDPCTTMRRAFRRLDLEWDPAANVEIANFVTPSLNRSARRIETVDVPDAHATYTRLRWRRSVQRWRQAFRRVA